MDAYDYYKKRKITTIITTIVVIIVALIYIIPEINARKEGYSGVIEKKHIIKEKEERKNRIKNAKTISKKFKKILLIGDNTINKNTYLYKYLINLGYDVKIENLDFVEFTQTQSLARYNFNNYGTVLIFGGYVDYLTCAEIGDINDAINNDNLTFAGTLNRKMSSCNSNIFLITMPNFYNKDILENGIKEYTDFLDREENNENKLYKYTDYIFMMKKISDNYNNVHVIDLYNNFYVSIGQNNLYYILNKDITNHIINEINIKPSKLRFTHF